MWTAMVNATLLAGRTGTAAHARTWFAIVLTESKRGEHGPGECAHDQLQCPRPWHGCRKDAADIIENICHVFSLKGGKSVSRAF